MRNALRAEGFTHHGRALQPIVFVLIASILSTGSPAVAQGVRQSQSGHAAGAEMLTAAEPPGHADDETRVGSVGLPLSSFSYSGSGVIRDAIARVTVRLAPGSTAVQLSTPAIGRSWPARHPVLLGALIGAGAGVIIDSAVCGWGGGGCGFTFGGAGAGAFAGLLASARPKPAFRVEPSSSQPDIVAVERVVKALGIGERIVVTDANAKEIRGSIQAIGQDRFLVVSDEQATPVEIVFSEVRSVRKKPLGTAAKVGIAAGVVGAVLTVVTAATYRGQ